MSPVHERVKSYLVPVLNEMNYLCEENREGSMETLSNGRSLAVYISFVSEQSLNEMVLKGRVPVSPV